MAVWITSGNRPSNGRKALQLATGFRKFKPLRAKPGDTLINWGCSGFPNDHMIPGIHVVQTPTAVLHATNKLMAFEVFGMNNVSTVPFTTNKEVVKEWLEKYTVVARTTLTGHSGEGIIILEPKTVDIPDARVYTRYIFKTHEYRVHVLDGKVIDTQRKIRDPDREPTNWKVRSHDNGFIFARSNISDCGVRDSLAISAINCLGLFFGAVDIIRDKEGNYYVLEVNTAPGLEGQTVESYATALKAIYGN